MKKKKKKLQFHLSIFFLRKLEKSVTHSGIILTDVVNLSRIPLASTRPLISRAIPFQALDWLSFMPVEIMHTAVLGKRGANGTHHTRLSLSLSRVASPL